MPISLTWKKEKELLERGFEYVIGVDEVGRGCLAGPVVAGAAILPLPFDESTLQNFSGVKDSKLMTIDSREKQFLNMVEQGVFHAVAEVDHLAIDEMNIHHASLLAMRRAVDTLMGKLPGQDKKSIILIDGKFLIPDLDFEQEAVVDGDAKILSIAAASIFAKVYRDELMGNLHNRYPSYGFSNHKGYATLEHRTAIIKHGLSEIHRKSFCRKYI